MVFNAVVEQALLSTGGAEPRDHELERWTSLEWGHGGHRSDQIFWSLNPWTRLSATKVSLIPQN